MPRSPERSAGGDSTRLRVLLVTDEMEVGGTQRQIVHLARGLDPLRFEVTVLYFRNRSHFVDQLERSGLQVICVPKRGRIDPRFVVAMVRTMARGRFDVVHAFAFSGELWSTVAHALLAFGSRPALLTSIRGTYDWYGTFQWKVKRWVSQRSWRVVSNSRIGAQFALEKTGIDADRIEIIYNGVVAEPIEPGEGAALRAAWKTASDETVLLFVGRLVDIKDLPTLLRAMGRLAVAAHPVRLVIAGEGPLRSALAAQTSALALGQRVLFLGQRDDVAALIQAADAVVLPSRREGMSNVVLEAMLGGRPVIASRAGGNVELVEANRTGLLFDVGDDSGLATQIEALAADPDLRHRLGSAGAERARSAFGVTAMVRAFESLYLCAHADNSRLRPAQMQR
jgi:glycosyltransferase involved in cell wall biosynthesis